VDKSNCVKVKKMKQAISITAMILVGHFVSAQSVNPQLIIADSLYQLGQYQESTKLYEQYINTNRSQVDKSQLYKLAVAHAHSGDAIKSVLWLQKALDLGIDDIYLSDTRFDLNFYPIQHTKAWKIFLHKNTVIFEHEAENIAYPRLRHELLQLWQSDQQYRRLIFGRYNGSPPNEIGNVTEAIDRYNTMRVEQIMEEIGLPTFSKVGKDGAHAAWNIIQHAVFNPPLMRKYLDKMKIALDNEEVDGVDYAYLFDRFNAVCYLGKQDYGIVRQVPIRDEHMVEQRRLKAGFEIFLEKYLGTYELPTKEAYDNKEKKLESKYEQNLNKGLEELNNKNYKAASSYFAEVMLCKGYIETEDIYNAAKIQALLNTRRSNFQAIRYIRSLSARGYRNLEALNNEPAFEVLKDEKGFKEILRIIEKYNTN